MYRALSPKQRIDLYDDVIRDTAERRRAELQSIVHTEGARLIAEVTAAPTEASVTEVLKSWAWLLRQLQVHGDDTGLLEQLTDIAAEKPLE
jgi:hypothetical protein